MSPTKTSSSASGKKRLLIVEDERPLAHALELKFSHEGYEVVTCSNGKDALEKLEEGSFEVMLLDLIMPGMNGFDVLEAMKSNKDTTPVIILSNLGQDEDRERASELGAKGYFVKSNTPIADIVKNVKSFL